MSTKYAVTEHERRFRLDAVPAAATDPRRITDRYLDATRLRLREVVAADGTVQRKLGHKRRLDEADPRSILCTSLYLDDAEWATLWALPGRLLHKTRHRLVLDDGTAAAIDEFGDHLAGLVLLEVDLGDRDRLDAWAPPGWAGVEVTDDERFTGGWLAGRTLTDLDG